MIVGENAHNTGAGIFRLVICVCDLLRIRATLASRRAERIGFGDMAFFIFVIRMLY